MTLINLLIYKSIREFFQFKKEHQSNIFYAICKKLFWEQEFFMYRKHLDLELSLDLPNDTAFAGNSGFSYSGTESYIFGILELDPFFDEHEELHLIIDDIEGKKFMPDLLKIFLNSESRIIERQKKENKEQMLSDEGEENEENKNKEDIDEYGQFIIWPYFVEYNSSFNQEYISNAEARSGLGEGDIKKYSSINYPFIKFSKALKKSTHKWWCIKEWSMYLPEMHNDYISLRLLEPFESQFERNPHKEYFSFYINVYISYFLQHYYNDQIYDFYRFNNCNVISSLSLFEQDIYSGSYDLDEFDKTNFTYTVLMGHYDPTFSWDNALFRLYGLNYMSLNDNYNTLYYDEPFKNGVFPFISNWSSVVQLQYVAFNKSFNLSVTSLRRKFKYKKSEKKLQKSLFFTFKKNIKVYNVFNKLVIDRLTWK